MDPMLMAIIGAVVVVILVGFFVMKSRGKKTPPSTNISTANPKTPISSNRPKTLAEQQRELASRPATPTPSPTDALVTAQQYFDQKDYTNAVNSLKTAISTQPNRADLQLLLLKTYAQQKNYADFDTTFSSLSALSDKSVIAEASTLKQLVEEEQSQALAHVIDPTSANSSTSEDMLDFDVSDFDMRGSQAAVSSTNNTKLSQPSETPSFGDLESQVVASNNPITPAKAHEDTDFDFDLDLDFDSDTPSPAIQPASLPTVISPTVEDDLDFPELTVAQSTPTPTLVGESVNQPSTDKSEMDFDFDDFDFETPATSTTSASPVTAISGNQAESGDLVLDDFDFELSTDTPATSQTVTTFELETEQLATEFEDFDFNLADETANQTNSAYTMLTESKVEETKAEVLSDDEFDFDLNDMSASDTSHEFNLPVKPTDSTQVETSMPVHDFSTDTVDQLDSLFADEVPFTPSSESATTTAPVLVDTPTADLTSTFAFIKDMDTTQLNLDLAEQYIELGEYDSAKRLLGEITNANPTQQSMVQNLLEKIG